MDMGFENMALRLTGRGGTTKGVEMVKELRPRYYYFRGYSKAKEFADKLNSRARVNRWLVRANVEPGYTVYNIRLY